MKQIFQYVTMIALLSLMLTSSTNYVQIERFLCILLNIKSLRNQFDFIKDLKTENTSGLLFISVTKLDYSFVNAHLVVDN